MGSFFGFNAGSWATNFIHNFIQCVLDRSFWGMIDWCFHVCTNTSSVLLSRLGSVLILKDCKIRFCDIN